MAFVLFFSKAADPDARYLSNFQPARVELDGVVYPSVENAFQAAKYLRSDRPDLAPALARMAPAEAKSAGSRSGMRRRGATLDLRRWDVESEGVMRRLVAQRLRTDARFRGIVARARAAGTRLLHFERSCERSIWGGCFPTGSPRTVHAFRGGNLLGRILESVPLP